ncbi:MAG: hypothetical protein ABSE73_11115 [Planctomycetota bacterium]
MNIPLMGFFVLMGVIVIGVIGAGVFAMWLDYRHKASKTGAAAGGKVESLEQRLAALEKQCARLEEQVLQAHVLLADEQRQLDHKLAAILPEATSATPESVPARNAAPLERARG